MQNCDSTSTGFSFDVDYNFQVIIYLLVNQRS